MLSASATSCFRMARFRLRRVALVTRPGPSTHGPGRDRQKWRDWQGALKWSSCREVLGHEFWHDNSTVMHQWPSHVHCHAHNIMLGHHVWLGESKHDCVWVVYHGWPLPSTLFHPINWSFQPADHVVFPCLPNAKGLLALEGSLPSCNL